MQDWDVIVVGAGHNGLTCAAYLARAGKRVLILEARERLGGACTIEEPFPGVKMSPCAYVNGLLHPLVVRELNLAARGFVCHPASNGLFVPFEDGSSVQLYEDDELCAREIARISPRDVVGFHEMSAVMRRLRDAIRPPDERDMWIGEPPAPDELEERIGDDDEARALLFEWSMAEFVERYFEDERMQLALMGQGIIGTNASPFEPGTASIRFHHSSGRLDGLPGTWGYVEGGMGMVSFYLADAAREAGVTIQLNAPVAQIVPGQGVILETADRIDAPIVVSNADPRVTLRLCVDPDPAWRAQVESIPIQGCTLKINMWLRELPNFTARPGTLEPHHYSQINAPLTKTEWAETFATAQDGRLAKRLWAEMYFQSVFDSSAAPPGTHTMSAFVQYVPYAFEQGSWDDHREEVKATAFASIARFCSNFPDAVIGAQVMGPPDIEKKVGLTGGHIFQGDCRPQYMWSNRLPYKTPMDGVYLCGACTHPGGSVIAINGRNAAMRILSETALLG